MRFVVVRLGKNSVEDINTLDDISSVNRVPLRFTFTCTQVEAGIGVGDYVLIWLGSDNNKGQPTEWKQGLRAIGRIIELARGAGHNDDSDIEIEIVSIFPESIDQLDFLERSASHYKYFSKYPVVGVRSSRNNAIQRVNEGDRQRTAALLTAVNIFFPVTRNQLQANAPELVGLLGFVPVGDVQKASATSNDGLDDDNIWAWVSNEIFSKHERNFLFLGAPGTGKTWYAREIALKLTENDPERHAFVQFHPSFSYDDFVEGYTPKLSKGSATVEYSLSDKHFLKLCGRAKSDGGSLYVLVIDELTRGDPSRVFGELLTYIEVEHRDRLFSLAYSGEGAFVPQNLVIIATANPYDRSVGELDDALIRRFAVREFSPDAGVLETQLRAIGTDDALVGRLLHTFGRINDHLPVGFGHSHFWNVRTEDDFHALWKSRILFILKRAFLFDDGSLDALTKEVEEIFPALQSPAHEGTEAEGPPA